MTQLRATGDAFTERCNKTECVQVWLDPTVNNVTTFNKKCLYF